jgi:hypothetical protein
VFNLHVGTEVQKAINEGLYLGAALEAEIAGEGAATFGKTDEDSGLNFTIASATTIGQPHVLTVRVAEFNEASDDDKPVFEPGAVAVSIGLAEEDDDGDGDDEDALVISLYSEATAVNLVKTAAPRRASAAPQANSSQVRMAVSIGANPGTTSWTLSVPGTGAVWALDQLDIIRAPADFEPDDSIDMGNLPADDGVVAVTADSTPVTNFADARVGERVWMRSKAALPAQFDGNEAGEWVLLHNFTAANIRAHTVTVAGSGISTVAGSAIAAGSTITVTLAGATWEGDDGDTLGTDWIVQALGANVTATAVRTSGTVVTITIAGTPPVALTSRNLTVRIPEDAFTGGNLPAGNRAATITPATAIPFVVTAAP